jgi:hypothetical protein
MNGDSPFSCKCKSERFSQQKHGRDRCLYRVFCMVYFILAGFVALVVFEFGVFCQHLCDAHSVVEIVDGI